MATHLVLQASGAMFETLQPKGWTFCFGVFVCDNEGAPVEFLRVFLFRQDCGSYLAAEFVGNGHDAFLKE